MTSRRVAIVGGTAGVGAELAGKLRFAGDEVIAVGRRAGADVQVDLANPEAASGIANALERFAPLDMLILNAADAWIGPFHEQPAESIERLIHVNLEAPLRIARALLLQLRPLGGRLVFVGSPVGATPSPDYAVYAATKAALEACARSLRAELAGRVQVQVLFPRATNTELLARGGIAQLGVDPSRFASPRHTAAWMAARLDGSARWRTQSWPDAIVRRAAVWTPGVLEARRRPRLAIPRLPHSERRLAVVTGAAQGIGRALVERLLRDDWQVLACDRDVPKLRELAALDPRVTIVESDLAEAACRMRLLDRLAELGPCRLFVHNAGINRFGRFETLAEDAMHDLIAVNFAAPILLTRESFARNVLTHGGSLAFVSSLAHFVGYPGSAVYHATKTGLAAFASSMHALGAAAGFRVLTVYPGPTRTQQAFDNSPDNSRAARRMDPALVADRLVSAVGRRRWLVPGIANKVFAGFGLAAPRLTEWLLRRALLDAPAKNRPNS